MFRPREKPPKLLSRFTLRFSARDRALIEAAAAAHDCTPSDLVRASAVRAAKEVLGIADTEEK